MKDLVKPCKDQDNALLERVEDATGRRMYRVKLDRLKGLMGIEVGPDTGGKVVPSSEAFVSERHVDEYVAEIAAVMAPLIRLLGSDTAWNLVLSERNGDPERDRMRAAKAVAAMTDDYRKVVMVLESAKYNWKIDAYDHHDVWVVKGAVIQPERDALQNVVCALHIGGGKIHMGNGDGYHRGFDERPFCTVRRFDAGILRRAVEKERKREEREAMEFSK